MGLNTAASLSFSQINSTVFFTNGNLGVNTTSPAFNLDVNGTINISGKSTLQNITATNISSTNLVTTSVTSGILSATNNIGTNISAGTLSATTITGSNLSLSNNLIVGGTLTTVNIASTNMVNTNISTSTLNVSGTSTLTNTTATNISTGILIASTGITSGTIRATGTSSFANTTSTNVSSSTLIATTSVITTALSTSNITVSSLIANTGITTSSLNANVLNLSQNINNLLISTDSLTNSIYQQFINGNGARGIIGLDGTNYAGFNSGAFLISTWSNNPLNFATNQALRATITTNGNFGINTATPAYTLDVNGSINASTSITTAALSATAISSGSIRSTGLSTGALLSSVGITTGSIVTLNNSSIYLRTGADTNNGLEWGSLVNGIQVYGNSGGMLGYNSNSPSLYWNGNNQVGIGGIISNSLSNKLSINTTTDTAAINNDATNTLLVYEDMQGTSLRSGQIQGATSYVQNTGGTTGYVQLSPDGGGSGDWWWYNRNLGNAFTVDYEIQSPGNGNEYWFYWGATANTNNTGYVVVFNELADSISLYFGGFIATASVGMGGSANWFKVRIVYQRNVIKVYYNGVLVINYKDTVERNLNYSNNQIGFYTPSSVSAHRIRELKIQKLVEGLWSYQSQTSGNILYNGGNVGINTSSPTQALDINGNAMIRGNLYSSASTSAIPLPKASGSFYWNGSAIVSNNLYNCTVTRTYTGNYVVTFTNAMSDGFYTITTSFQTMDLTDFVQYYDRSTAGFNLQYFDNNNLIDNTQRIGFVVW